MVWALQLRRVCVCVCSLVASVYCMDKVWLSQLYHNLGDVLSQVVSLSLSISFFFSLSLTDFSFFYGEKKK